MSKKIKFVDELNVVSRIVGLQNTLRMGRIFYKTGTLDDVRRPPLLTPLNKKKRLK